MNALGGVGEGESLPDPLPDDPFGIAETWFNDARDRAVQPNPNAMTLATADETGAPSARIVLCKHFDADSGSVIFYTNYQSRKGRELEANPRAALVMHWDALDRQIRITGPVTHAPAEQSDAYFASRAWEKRLGAWSSDQSQPIESREALLMQVAERAVELDIDLRKIVDGHADELVIPRPPHWGGYRVWAETVELWCSGVGRVHDRALWRRDLTRDGDDYNAGPWSSTRLQP
ncbi:MAG: pyridoxamine 5'-phosphate oxidase [Phycisphaerae bacterium]|nr:pyridoxamine 5'-phosphate oxidase [Phycisphaerae bacterium]